MPVDDVTAEEALGLIAWFIGAGRGSGRTFQVAATFASMTVRENVQLALLAHAGTQHRIGRRATVGAVQSGGVGGHDDLE